jgi:hypothetical protein
MASSLVAVFDNDGVEDASVDDGGGADNCRCGGCMMTSSELLLEVTQEVLKIKTLHPSSFGAAWCLATGSSRGLRKCPGTVPLRLLQDWRWRCAGRRWTDFGPSNWQSGDGANHSSSYTGAAATSE